MNINNKIKELCYNNHISWSNHFIKRILQRNIKIENINEYLINGKIIKRKRSNCIIFGYDANQNALHIVCGISNKKLFLITAYYPNRVI